MAGWATSKSGVFGSCIVVAEEELGLAEETGTAAVGIARE